MWLVEILFFAVLSFYLFFRLWSVLGSRDGYERKFNAPQDDNEEHDNVVILSQRKKSNDFQGSLKEDYKNLVLEIRKYNPDFSLETFLKNAKQAFSIILKAYIDNDRDTLKMLLDNKVYAQFIQAIDARLKENQTIKNEIIGEVEASLDHMEKRGDDIIITVKFISEQCHVTYDSENNIMDNPAKIAIQITDYWSFSRDIRSKDPLWKMTSTRSSSPA